jgi:hypothetical protein
MDYLAGQDFVKGGLTMGQLYTASPVIQINDAAEYLGEFFLRMASLTLPTGCTPPQIYFGSISKIFGKQYKGFLSAYVSEKEGKLKKRKRVFRHVYFIDPVQCRISEREVGSIYFRQLVWFDGLTQLRSCYGHVKQLQAEHFLGPETMEHYRRIDGDFVQSLLHDVETIAVPYNTPDYRRRTDRIMIAHLGRHLISTSLALDGGVDAGLLSQWLKITEPQFLLNPNVWTSFLVSTQDR